MSRFGLILGGLAWVCVATTLCGCAQVNGWAMNQSGQGYYRRGNYTAARYEFERALIDNPYNSSYAYNVARAMEKQGDSMGAEQMFQHALTIDPAHQPAYHGLTEMLLAQGRSDDARNLLTSWASTQPYNPASQVELARFERQTGDVFSSEQRLQAALQASPRNTRALDEMGQTQYMAGRPTAAMAFYDRSLAVNPFQPNVLSRRDAVASSNVPSGAIQMANYMPQMDPTMINAPALRSYTTTQPMPSGMMGPGQMNQFQQFQQYQQFPAESMMSSPAPMNAPVQMGPPMLPQQMGPQPTPVPSSGAMLPQGHAVMMPQQSFVHQPGMTPYPQQMGAPMMMPNQHVMPAPMMQHQTMMPQQMHAPMMAPQMSAPQMMPQPMMQSPIELGQPTPITQSYPTMGAPMMSLTPPAVQAF